MAAAHFRAAVFFLRRSMGLKKTLHHEGHGDHKDISWGCMPVVAYPQGRRQLSSNLLFFFMVFVFFVVPIPFQG
jgi:hypothetical protein